MGIRSKQAFLKETHANGPELHEELLKITNNQGNANPNHRKLSPDFSYIVYYQKAKC